jgi:hypothetical protein
MWPDRVDASLVLHGAGHFAARPPHDGAGASVPSTVPRHTHMVGLMSNAVNA